MEYINSILTFNLTLLLRDTSSLQYKFFMSFGDKNYLGFLNKYF